MSSNDDKIRVSARISKDLYDSVLKIDDNFTRALIAALTAFTEPKDKECQTIEDNSKTDYDKAQYDIIKAQLDIMTAQVEYLKGQISIKDQQIDKQAFSLQSVIQENSRLNLKLLPEGPAVSEKKSLFSRLKFW